MERFGVCCFACSLFSFGYCDRANQMTNQTVHDLLVIVLGVIALGVIGTGIAIALAQWDWRH